MEKTITEVLNNLKYQVAESKKSEFYLNAADFTVLSLAEAEKLLTYIEKLEKAVEEKDGGQNAKN